MESRQPGAAERRLRGLFSVVALIAVAVAGVTIAMTTLGNTVPDETPTPTATASASPTGGAASAYVQATDTPEPVQTVPLPGHAPTILIIYSNAHEPSRVWEIVWRYPQLKGGTTPLAATINADILNEVQTRMDAFKSGPAATEQQTGKTNTLTGNFTVNMNAPDLVSLTLRWTDDTSPDRPTVSVQTLNYALASGQRLNLGDMFTDRQAALSIISTVARQQLRQNLGGDYDPTVAEPGTTALASNFNNWALTASGLSIMFDEYQVGGYADGMPVVLIPWETLRDVMNPNGPAGRLAGLKPIPTPTLPPWWTPPPTPTPEPTDTPEPSWPSFDETPLPS